MSLEDDPFERIGEALASDDARGARTPAQDLGEFVCPVPGDAPELLKRNKTHGTVSRTWRYLSAAGEVLFAVCRFDKPDGTKVVLPQTFWRDERGSRWRWKAPPGARPLYGLHDLALRPAAPVLIVEGEKTADAARERFTSYVVVSWQGGSKATGKADWSPLADRDVTIWPDADEPGKAAALEVTRRLEPHGLKPGVVQLPASLPEGWDLADPWPRHFGAADALEALRSAVARSAETTWPKGYQADDRGLWWAPEDNGKGEPTPPLWLCGRLDILAMARDEEGSDWSTVVEFRDMDGRSKRDIIGRAELAGDGVEVRRRLMGQGLPMSSNKTSRERLQSALCSVVSSERARLAASTGWKGQLYVLPHRTIGAAAGETVIYRGRASATHYGERGSYADWRGQVAAKASGNAFLVLGLSCAFAAPLMRMLAGEGGGFHVRGQSSSGKTTILQVAGSVWGGGGELGFAQSWRNTGNALEAVALAHNDNLLCLDELRLLDPSEAATAAYSLSAGVSKGRLRADAEMRARPTWRTLVLSAGEVGFRELILLAPRTDRLYAGQELRLIDLEADLEAGLGAWQALHGADGPADFSERLKVATSAHFGHAGPMFLERILADGDDVKGRAERLQAAFLAKVGLAGDTGQAQRGAQRFALAAVSGELAAAYDIVPWQAGEASNAAALLFKRWATAFGRSTPREDLEAVRRVRSFLERYRYSRFRVLRPGLTEKDIAEEEMYGQATGQGGGQREGEARSLDMAGYVAPASDNGSIYHFSPGFWREDVFKGMDGLKAAEALKAAGFLVSNGEDDRRLTNKVRTPEGNLRFYSVRRTILETDDEPTGA